MQNRLLRGATVCPTASFSRVQDELKKQVGYKAAVSGRASNSVMSPSGCIASEHYVTM